MRTLVPIGRIDRSILIIRGQKVMLDADLGDLYGVPTKVLNQAVKRNKERFPDDFMFRLNKQEKEEVVTNRDHLRRLKFSPTMPYAFTEHGALMLASVLNSPVAIRVSIEVVRAFIRLRGAVMSYKELARKVEALEQKYDSQFKVVFDAIRKLMEPVEQPKPRIGFGAQVER